MDKKFQDIVPESMIVPFCVILLQENLKPIIMNFNYFFYYHDYDFLDFFAAKPSYQIEQNLL